MALRWFRALFTRPAAHRSECRAQPLLGGRPAKARTAAGKGRPPRTRPGLESLEDRLAPAAGINVVKLTNGTDNDSAPGIFVPVGSTVIFSYSVTNPGDVPVASVVVTDDQGVTPVFQGGDTNANGLLEPGET